MASGKIQISAHRRLAFGEAEDRLLRVCAGMVELFLVWETEAMGARRHHFATLTAGSTLFDVGFGFRDHGISILAVGYADTEVEWVATPSVEAPEERRKLARELDRWLEALFKGIATFFGEPKRFSELLTPGPTVAWKPGAIAGSAGPPLWWHSEGATLFWGVKEVDVEWVPLAFGGWIDAPGGVAASHAIATEALVAFPGWLDEVARAHDLFLRSIQEALLARTQREWTDREQRALLREEAGGEAWQTIASVFATGRERRQGAPGQASVVFAFECVAGAMGIALPGRMPRPRQEGEGIELAELVRAASIRKRRVVLEPGWWQRDNGPLIGFLTQEGEAVALLPRRGRYLMLRQTGEEIPVTAEVAARLGFHAEALYRTLPDRRLTLRDLLAFGFRGNRGDVVMLVAMVLATGLLGIVLPALTGRTFDLIIPQGDRALMWQVGAALVSAAVVRALLELVRGVALIRIGSRTDAGLQAAVWDRLLKLPARFFRRFTAGDLVNRAQGISEIHHALLAVGTTALFALPTGLFQLLVMFYFATTLALWGLGMALLAVVVSLGLQLRRVGILRRHHEIEGRLAGLVFELISGVAKFRIAGAEQLAFATWAKDYARQQRLAMEAGRREVVIRTFFSGFALASQLVIFAVTAWYLRREGGPGLTTGTFLAFSIAFGALVASLTMVADASLQLLRLFPLMERVRPILEAEPENAAGRVEPGVLLGGIEMNQITFRYHESLPPVLERFSLRVEPGEFVAIVGPSGSGKSTVLRLLLGFETAQSGTVLYDGKDLQTLDPRALRRQIGVVLQGSRLVAGNLYRNIVGESSLTLEDAWQAAEMAGLADDIRAMPMGMQTVVSEGATSFSGGQRQRLALARALVHRPRLLFFDEATSALDNRTQGIVSASLASMQATRIVVAHRLSTIAGADRIVVLSEGKIAEEGNYAGLMARKGRFYELATRQLLGE
ncbi:MAG TPA: NHLP bacteriocin export ABC transporter permease/ATPase subunit [Chthoniobacteraceae bacterium]|nr:NHLP bacteriocin export ABC transporter permease/ATPase subunit [Chthoniobacteraceae bacterium]